VKSGTDFKLPEQIEVAARTRGEWVVYGLGDSNRPKPKAVFPGAFNPLHEGHCRIAEASAEILNTPIEFELSVSNVDKPPLSRHEVARRVDLVPPEQTVWVTHAATFAEKARLFPECVFVVGADTITRIADARYYGDHLSLRDIAIDDIARHGCRFLVFGRLLDDGFHTLSDLPLPERLRSISQEVPAHQFRVDISSTEVRLRRD
jgi:nicotinic acid mononucleotide adenylyltransferase